MSILYSNIRSTQGHGSMAHGIHGIHGEVLRSTAQVASLLVKKNVLLKYLVIECDYSNYSSYWLFGL